MKKKKKSYFALKFSQGSKTNNLSYPKFVLFVFVFFLKEKFYKINKIYAQNKNLFTFFLIWFNEKWPKLNLNRWLSHKWVECVHYIPVIQHRKLYIHTHMYEWDIVNCELFMFS